MRDDAEACVDESSVVLFEKVLFEKVPLEKVPGWLSSCASERIFHRRDGDGRGRNGRGRPGLLRGTRHKWRPTQENHPGGVSSSAHQGAAVRGSLPL